MWPCHLKFLRQLISSDLKGILFQTANVLVAKTKNKKDVSSTPELKTGSELRDKNKRFLSVAAIIFLLSFWVYILIFVFR